MSTITKIEKAKCFERKFNIETQSDEFKEYPCEIEVRVYICDECGKELKHGNYVYSNGKHTCFNCLTGTKMTID